MTNEILINTDYIIGYFSILILILNPFLTNIYYILVYKSRTSIYLIIYLLSFILSTIIYSNNLSLTSESNGPISTI